MRNIWRSIQWPFIIALIIGSITFIPLMRAYVVNIFAPAISATRQSGEGVGNTFRLIGTIPTLARENGVLQAQINELKSVEIKNKELLHENELLRKELSLSGQDTNGNLIAAQVIARTSSVSQQYITVNKGTNDGFSSGMAVVAQGFFVGVVDEVHASTSRIKLMTSVESLIPVVLQNSRSLGLLKGGADGLVIDEIPRDVKIDTQEAVVTANVGNIVRGGIPVGTVSVILSGKSDVFQSARIQSPIDFSRLEIIFGVK